jgi:hypothetical protein
MPDMVPVRLRKPASSTVTLAFLPSIGPTTASTSDVDPIHVLLTQSMPLMNVRMTFHAFGRIQPASLQSRIVNLLGSTIRSNDPPAGCKPEARKIGGRLGGVNLSVVDRFVMKKLPFTEIFAHSLNNPVVATGGRETVQFTVSDDTLAVTAHTPDAAQLVSSVKGTSKNTGKCAVKDADEIVIEDRHVAGPAASTEVYAANGPTVLVNVWPATWPCSCSTCHGLAYMHDRATVSFNSHPIEHKLPSNEKLRGQDDHLPMPRVAAIKDTIEEDGGVDRVCVVYMTEKFKGASMVSGPDVSVKVALVVPVAEMYTASMPVTPSDDTSHVSVADI